MSTGKYISMEKFNALAKEMEKNLIEKASKEEGVDPKNISVDFKLFKGNKLVNGYMSFSKGFILSDKSPEVYRFVGLDKNSDEFVKSSHLRVVIDILDTVPLEDTLNLSEDTYTFNTFEGYLQFFHDKCKEIVGEGYKEPSIVTELKGTGLCIDIALHDKLQRDDSLPPMSITSYFTSLNNYRTLPESVRKEMDEIVCPLVVESKDVSFDPLWRYVYVVVDKPNLVEQMRCTETYKDEFARLMETSS